MISLIIPPKDQISRVAKMLADEFGTASNIKSRVNRYINHKYVWVILCQNTGVSGKIDVSFFNGWYF